MNKIAGAVLGTALAVFGLRELSGLIYEAETPEKPGFLIEVAEAGGTEGGTETGGETAVTATIGALLASADAAKGATTAKACAACHTFESGGANKVGPNLYDIVERSVGAAPGFAYSEGIKARAAEKWDYAALNTFLTSPKDYVKGTKMAFAGVKKDPDRANLIAYLASLSAAPKPFPAP